MILSIITINLNNVIGLRKTMESLVGQTFCDYEWIVIDGGSTDGSKELLETYRKRITHLVSEPDSGIYEAMNKGIALAQGEYLLFMNSGDRFANHSVLEYFFTHHDHADFIVGCSIQEGKTPSSKALNRSMSLKEEVFFLCTGAYPHQATFIRRTVFEKTGLYREDKRIASDWYQTINALFMRNATVSHLPVLVSICEKDGISSRMSRELGQERRELIHENPYFAVLFDFYTSNLEIVTALKDHRFVFFLFRIYFFLYRKLKPSRL